jgi:hypothetical protein
MMHLFDQMSSSDPQSLHLFLTLEHPSPEVGNKKEGTDVSWAGRSCSESHVILVRIRSGSRTSSEQKCITSTTYQRLSIAKPRTPRTHAAVPLGAIQDLYVSSYMTCITRQDDLPRLSGSSAVSTSTTASRRCAWSYASTSTSRSNTGLGGSFGGGDFG